MEEYHCYIEGCTGGYFGTCDICESDGCSEHIAITSKFAVDDMPFNYLCHPCMDERRKEYEAAHEGH